MTSSAADLRRHQLGSWHSGPLVGFDVETTSVDPETARIVSAAVVTVQAGRPANSVYTWLINPGVPIEPSAVLVHGITDRRVQQNGLDPDWAIAEIRDVLRDAWSKFRPVVIYNAPFDLTVLDRELRRHDEKPFNTIGSVIDPFVLDKLVDPYRKGSRRLYDVASHYGVGDLTEGREHGALRDARTAMAVAARIGRRFEQIGSANVDRLQSLQTFAKKRQADGLREYFERTGNPEADRVDGSWPIRPWGS